MPNPALAQHLLLRVLVDEFVRCGVEHAVTSPGSRSTPIVQALVRDGRLQLWSHVDERDAGFFALGAAKASGRPVLLTCTSGTATANLMPAVIEAHHARVPLIVLTADRPAELREVGAGQTIDQVKLYGDAARWYFEPDLSDATPEHLRFTRALACRAYATAATTAPLPGPVHLNMPLREPLVLDQPLPDPGPSGTPSGGRHNNAPWVTIDRPETIPRTPRRHEFAGVVFVAGELGIGPEAHANGARLAAFAARAGVPLLADPQSGARQGPAAIAHYDLILRDPETAAKLKPQVVCRIGELPTSKPLRTWIAGLDDAYHVAFAADDAWSDPASQLLQRTVGPLNALFDRLETDEVVAAPPEWLAAWREADDRVAAILTATLANSPATPVAGPKAGLNEPAVAHLLGAELPGDTTLVVASSMPVRDVEEFFPARANPPRVLSNRGANGIDGTVSAAFGSAATTRPVVLLIGDVALAHDIGGLLAAQRTGLPLTIVLVNNDGGGIFHFLPIATQAETFEQHVATPHGLKFEHAAALYGCQYEHVSTLGALRAAITRSLTQPGTQLIELQTDRVANRRLHANLSDAAQKALAG
jgi:2-succinyl-5-enolpyruvyl-6-hydroxy-3-cyclohexene-1-carboxylate synthase